MLYRKPLLISVYIKEGRLKVFIECIYTRLYKGEAYKAIFRGKYTIPYYLPLQHLATQRNTISIYIALRCASKKLPLRCVVAQRLQAIALLATLCGSKREAA